MRRNSIYLMDCLEGMKQLDDGIADGCVTDPPYGISFMNRKWDHDVPAIEIWRELLRVLKPGAHLLCACGTRTQHRMAFNIEAAGFEIRDVICWHYGQGFPKSTNIYKALAKRHKNKGNNVEVSHEWKGWGTTLKPATEFWTLARKPLASPTVVDNVLLYGTGAININICRIQSADAPAKEYFVKRFKPGATLNKTGGNWKIKTDGAASYHGNMEPGRFPANVILDEYAASEMDSQSGILRSGKPGGKRSANSNVYGPYKLGQYVTGYGDQGGASRFFYVAKADASDRGEGNYHPTVKPQALMQYLIKLICPIDSDRLIVDPFSGTGTTCIAAQKLGVGFIGFEKELAYSDIIKRRFREEFGIFDDVLCRSQNENP